MCETCRRLGVIRVDLEVFVVEQLEALHEGLVLQVRLAGQPRGVVGVVVGVDVPPEWRPM